MMSLKKKKNSPNRKRRVIIVILATCILALGAILYSLPTQPEPVDAMAFASAEIARRQTLHDAALERWKNRDFENYRYHILTDTKNNGGCSLSILVEGELSLLESEPRENCERHFSQEFIQQVPTIDQLMQDIQNQLDARECGINGCRCDGYAVFETVYHQTLGYPLSMEIVITGNIMIPSTVPPELPTTEYFSYAMQHDSCSLMGTWGQSITVLELEPL